MHVTLRNQAGGLKNFMAKGLRPHKSIPMPTPSDLVITNDEPRCWSFTPIEQGESVSSLNVSDSIYGNHFNARILINSNWGFVGFVPNAEATEIINFTSGTKKRLAGQVLANDGDVLIVELCAI